MGGAGRPAGPRHCRHEIYRFGEMSRPARPSVELSHDRSETSVATSPPTRSDSIRPNPSESDRMKPVADCNCTMAGMAMVVADAPGRERLCKTNPNDGRGQNLKASFFRGKMDMSLRIGPDNKTFFCETNPNEEKRMSASTDCKLTTYVKNFMALVECARSKTNPNVTVRLCHRASRRQRACSILLARERRIGTMAVET